MDRLLGDTALGLQVFGASLFQFIIFGAAEHQRVIAAGAILLVAGGLLQLLRRGRPTL